MTSKSIALRCAKSLPMPSKYGANHEVWAEYIQKAIDEAFRERDAELIQWLEQQEALEAKNDLEWQRRSNDSSDPQACYRRGMAEAYRQAVIKVKEL